MTIARFFLIGIAALFSPALSAQTIIGLDDTNRLLRFSAAAPGVVVANVPITGLQAGDNLVGIDRRPATGALYGLGASGRLYTIDPATAAATYVATLNVTLDGSFFGVDFNPVPDRLRVVSNTGQNLRINVDTGETNVDGVINPAGPMMGAAGYINNVAGAASTALYDIDMVSSTLFLQAPPNDGTVSAVGALGVTLDAGSHAALDVLTLAGDNFPHALLRVGGVTGLYTIDLTTGAATLVGAVGGNPSLRGMAIFDTPILPPAPATATGLALTSGNVLIRFAIANPGVSQASTPITGLVSGDTLLGIDFRPATGALYGLANSGNLYTINPATGAATRVAGLNVALSGTRFAVDFNPVPDRLRVISDTGQNLRINVDTGETAVDGSINPPGASIAAAAYTNSAAGATSTALFDIDPAAGVLYLQNPPNDGTLVSLGSVGVVGTPAAGFDILFVDGQNVGLATLTAGGTTGLYAVDVTLARALLVGAIAGNPTLVGFAVSPTAIAGGPGQPVEARAVPVDSPLALTLMVLLVVLGAAMVRRAA